MVVRAQDSHDAEYLENRLANDDALNQARSELEEVLGAQGGLSEQVGVLQMSNVEIQEAIDRLELDILRQRDHLNRILADQAIVEAELVAARAALLEAEENLEEQQRRLSNRIVSMYVYFEGQGGHLPFDVETASEIEEHHVLMTMIGEHDVALVESMHAAQVEAEKRREALEAARARLEKVFAEAEAQLRALGEREARQRELQAELHRRIEELHAEIHALEAAQAEVEAILNKRRVEIELEAAERDRLRAICFDNPRSPLDTDGSWVDCDSVGVSIPPMAFRWPLSTAVTSEYGPRWGRIHQGIDQKGDIGDPIYSAEGGRVDYLGWISGYGNTIIINHGGGATTLYGHLSGFAVSAGSAVSLGQVIGYVGNTGRSFGPHLHFEIRFDSIPVNPREYLP